jgi:hypothetical protein
MSTWRDRLPKNVSFYLLSEVAVAVAEGAGTVSDLVGPLRRTEPQVRPLLEQAESYGLLTVTAEHIELTPQGASLATAIQTQETSAERRRNQGFQPFTDYVPKRWWPEAQTK